MKKISIPVKAILITIIIFILGGSSAYSAEWIRGVTIKVIYTNFNLPPLSPPSWLFGPAWSVLYIILGIYCANLVSVSHNRFSLYFLTYFQLSLNIFWTLVFFSLNKLWLASTMILLMDLSVLLILILDQRKIRFLLLPYLLWLLFATYLCLGVLILN